MSFYYIDIGDKLFCAQSYQSEQTQVIEPEKSHTNHFWIYDVSGSMYSTLPTLRDDLIAKMGKLPAGDTLTLAWFSSEKLYKFFLISFEINKASDYAAAETLIRDNTRAMNLTCFSDSLSDVGTFVEIANKVKPGKNELTFFSDGYPVVSNYQKEIEKIKDAADKNKALFDSILLVGYGSYYNRDLMQKMAEWFDGSLLYSTDFASFSIALDEHIANTDDIISKKPVDLCEGIANRLLYSFYINESNISICTPTNGQVLVPLTKKRNERYVFSLINKNDTNGKPITKADFPKGAETISSSDFIASKGIVAQFVKGFYAAAVIANQKCETQLSLDILARIGDVICIDSLNNAFTNEEYAKAEETMRFFALNPKERFKTIPRNESYLPRPDAFCVLDAVKLLMEDDKAYFLPYHESFSYKRIGTRAQAKAGVQQTFAPKKDSCCSFNSLSWNQSLLNLSVRATINGTVDLIGDNDKFGLLKTYETHVFRNYSLIADGKVNIKTMPIKSSESTFLKLKKEGLVTEENWSADTVYDVSFEKLPVINRAMVKPKYSAKWLCERYLDELKLTAKIKVFKHLLDERTPEVAAAMLTLEEEKQKFLEENYILKNGFQPPTEQQEPTDWYFANSFEIKCKGLSSFPKVNDTIAKITAGKKLTKSDELIKAGIDEFKKLTGKQDEINTKIEEKIKEWKSEQLNIRHETQKTKFGLIIGKGWLEEFTTRENELKLNIGDNEFTLCFGQEKIGY